MALVPDTQTDDAAVHTPPAAPAGPGRVELAVQADIDAIPEGQRVRFHGSLSELALASARDMDSATSTAARTAARKDTFDVLKSLGAREGSEGNGALDAALDDFGTPLPGVSGMPA